MRAHSLIAGGLLSVATAGVSEAQAFSRLDGPFDDSVASYTLLTNGDMESHTGSTLSSWTDGTGGLHGYDSRVAYAGSGSSGLLDQTWTNSGAGVAMRQTVTVTPSSWYVLSGYIYNDISGGGNAYLDLADQSYTQADGGAGDCSSVSSSGHGDWQFVYCEFYVPSGTTSLNVRTITDGTIHAGSYANFDELALTLSGSFSPPESLSDDGDGDGYSELDGDCDDADASLSPGATEYCDGVDNDCDGSIDEASAADATTWYRDGDGDGYGDSGTSVTSCSSPVSYVSDDSDCDDGDAGVNPGAPETCNGVDDDCDGSTDEDSATDAATWYADGDGDGYGDAGTTTAACSQPSGYEADATDCDDGDASTNPGADEYCDGHDDDCDGDVDEDDAVDASTWYADRDHDGYGDSGDTTTACSQPTGYVANATDCDDADATVSPGATEYCDGHDDDCDGDVDEDDAVDASEWWEDQDGDGHGAPGAPVDACYQPADHAGDDMDCDDGDAAVYEGAPEICDGADNDCDGQLLEDEIDGDGDGAYLCEGDCDDDDPTIYPGAPGVTSVPGEYPTLQGAIDGADEGDVICVAAGTYTESIDFSGKGVHLYGVAGPHETVIDGEGSSRPVLFSGGESPATVLEGFTVTGGYDVNMGGCILVSASSPTLMDVWITDCHTTGQGGGMSVQGGSPALINVLVSDCTADNEGGGMYLYGGVPELTNVMVADNLADAGGGIYAYGSGAELTSVSLLGNGALSEGGGLYMEGFGYPDLLNVTVVGNEADTGGGIYLYNTSPIIKNLNTAGNLASTEGGGIYHWATPQFTYCNAWDNIPENYAGGADPTGLNGNISADPMFLSTAAADPLDWDLHLDSASGLYDTGVYNMYDPDGSRSDIGAYGGSDADDWDLDFDTYPDWWQPGAYDYANYPAAGWDCDDRDPETYPGSGC